MKFFIIAIMFLCYLNIGCSQNFGPGYSFDLFNNTPNWDLAKAVENENEKEIRRLVKEKNTDIDLREPKFGNSLLLLAIGNDKLISTRVLLEEGANINIADLEMTKPIHEATKFITLKKNSFEIIKLLIKYGANVNDTVIKKKNGVIVGFYTPLMGASQNLKCGKLLLENGANAYVKVNSSYIIWKFMENGKHDENIYFAKYLIIDKRMLIPDPIDYTLSDRRPLDIFYFLNKENFGEDLEKEKAKNEILEYLKAINFPKKGVFR